MYSIPPPTRSAGHTVPGLMELLSSDDIGERQLAAGALIKIDPANKAARDILTEAVPNLINELNDVNEGIPVFAADVLGRLGAAARAAIPALNKALTSNNSEVRTAAVEELAFQGKF
jgi:HEAT repeat protein